MKFVRELDVLIKRTYTKTHNELQCKDGTGERGMKSNQNAASDGRIIQDLDGIGNPLDVTTQRSRTAEAQELPMTL